jgi:hypothetical protein
VNIALGAPLNGASLQARKNAPLAFRSLATIRKSLNSRNGHDSVPSENYTLQRLAAGFPLGVERKARGCCTTTFKETRSLRPLPGNVQLIFLIAAIRICRIIRSYTEGFANSSF